jgi:two-component sensor histidine kinase
MKNDLALLSSMITLQARSQASPPVRTALESAAARLHVFAKGQDQLQSATDETVSMQGYLEDVCQRLGEALRGVRPIAVRVDCENVIINSQQAIRIGLMVNELATNALKHAFPNDRGGAIQVGLQRRPIDLIIMVEDDGVGCPDQLQIGLGSRLVTLLAEQSGGNIKRETANPGCRVIITVPHGLSENGNAQRGAAGSLAARGNIRRHGARGLFVTCQHRGHERAVGMDGWPDDATVPSYRPAHALRPLRQTGCEAVANWIERADRLPGGAKR